MNGIHYALRQIHAGENTMHQQLLKVAEQHHAEHEVHHVALDLAAWSHEHVRLIADHAAQLDLSLNDDADNPSRTGQRLRAAAATLSGHRPEPGLLLLHDLRELYLQASENSLSWEMLAQIAQAKRHDKLLELSAQCHPQTLRQIRWANTMIKTQSPQILSSI